MRALNRAEREATKARQAKTPDLPSLNMAPLPMSLEPATTAEPEVISNTKPTSDIIANKSPRTTKKLDELGLSRSASANPEGEVPSAKSLRGAD